MANRPNTLSKYLPSTRPGYTWSLYTYKPFNRNQAPYATAVEGIRTKTSESGFWGFRTIIPGSRRTQNVPVPGGRLTQKAQAQAMEALEKGMRELGLIAEGDVVEVSDAEADKMPA